MQICRMIVVQILSTELDSLPASQILHLQQCNTLGYLSSRLSRKGIHQFLHPVVDKEGIVVEKLGVWDVFFIDKEAVRHQGVPVVKVDKLHSNAIAVLELLFEEQGGIKLQLEQITAQLLHIFFNYDLNCFSWKTKANIRLG